MLKIHILLGLLCVPYSGSIPLVAAYTYGSPLGEELSEALVLAALGFVVGFIGSLVQQGRIPNDP
jgi:hypothetical protein